MKIFSLSLLCALCLGLSACATNRDFTDGIASDNIVNNRPAVDISEP
jgi:hypothetical protein